MKAIIVNKKAFVKVDGRWVITDCDLTGPNPQWPDKAKLGKIGSAVYGRTGQILDEFYEIIEDLSP